MAACCDRFTQALLALVPEVDLTHQWSCSAIALPASKDGSRFTPNGEVIAGPAQAPLDRLRMARRLPLDDPI